MYFSDSVKNNLQEYLYLSQQQIVDIHHYVLRISGGMQGILKPDYILSTIDFLQSKTYYPGFSDKISYMLYSLTMNHIFVDGNKRTALVSTAQFILLNTANKELVDRFIKTFEEVVVWIADGHLSKETLTKYVYTFFGNHHSNESTLLSIYKELQSHNIL